MDVNMGSTREGGMSSFRKSVSALAGVLFAGLIMAGIASPAGAAPPYPSQTQATALLGGTPLVEARCPAGPTVSGGTSTSGIVSVGSSAGARCATTAASTDGEYAIAGATPPLPNALRFSAQCVTAGPTDGGVDVPAGTNITGVGVVAVNTLVTTANTVVTYPNGTTAILNEIITTPTSVQRNAIRITSGPASGTIIGRVICGSASVYPLVADPGAASAAAPELAATSTNTGGSSSNTRILLLGGAALALLVLAQVTVGRSMWRRRRGVTGS